MTYVCIERIIQVDQQKAILTCIVENDRWKKQEPLKLPHHQWWKDEKGGEEDEDVLLYSRGWRRRNEKMV